jgi:hypothetical protein
MRDLSSFCLQLLVRFLGSLTTEVINKSQGKSIRKRLYMKREVAKTRLFYVSSSHTEDDYGATTEVCTFESPKDFRYG